MPNPYTLYGSYASYHTAKTRSYLLEKGTPFIERVPGVSRFRDYPYLFGGLMQLQIGRRLKRDGPYMAFA